MSVESIWMEIEEIGWAMAHVEKGSTAYNGLVADLTELVAELVALGESVDLTKLVAELDAEAADLASILN